MAEFKFDPPALVEVNNRIFYPSKKLDVFQSPGSACQQYKWEGVVLEWRMDLFQVTWSARIADSEVSCFDGWGTTPLVAIQQLQKNAKVRKDQFDAEVRKELAFQERLHAAFHSVLEDI